jgi:hypothetical protein
METETKRRQGRPRLTEEEKKLRAEKNRIYVCNLIKEKYHQDPEYRAKMIQRNSEYAKRCREALKQQQSITV